MLWSSTSSTCLPFNFYPFFAFLSRMKVAVADHAAVQRKTDMKRHTPITSKLSVNDVITASTQSMVGGPFDRGCVK